VVFAAACSLLPSLGLALPRRSLGCWLLALSFAGCLSPTLPLPPPEEPDGIFAAGDGAWELRGSCLEGAEVIVMNEATGRGEVYIDLELTGRYAVVLEGEPCDVAIISQSRGEEQSGETRVVLQEVEAGVPVDPDACR